MAKVEDLLLSLTDRSSPSWIANAIPLPRYEPSNNTAQTEAHEFSGVEISPNPVDGHGQAASLDWSVHWPMYDMRKGDEVAAEDEDLWQGAAAPDRLSFLQIASEGAASLNLATLEQSLERADISFRTDFVDQPMIDDWQKSTAAVREQWVPLSVRVGERR